MTDPFDERYQQTVFLLRSPLPNDWRHFCVLTACNPAGELKPSRVNTASTQALRRCLIGRDLSFYSVTGCSPDMTHQEMGFGIQTDINEASELAQLFNQLAFYWVQDDQLFLVESASLKKKYIGSWTVLTHV